MRSLLFLEEQLRRYWDGDRAGDADPSRRARTRPLVELFDPPAEPMCPTAAFVEIAADPRSSAVPDLLVSLGFQPVPGEDDALRTFRNGAARVVLNGRSDLELRRATALPRPSVAALGIAVDDPTRLMARAEALTWEPAARHGGTPEFTWPARRESRCRSPADQSRTAGAEGQAGIDHVGAAVTSPLGRRGLVLPHAVRATPRSGLGVLRPGGSVAQPVLLPRENGVRVVHNIVVRAGRAPTGVSPGGFACTDLLDRGTACAAGAATDVPGRVPRRPPGAAGLDAALLDRLRRSVLYDRDGEGELFHVYTPLVAGRFYGAVERRGGQRAGAANTPVRLAMQASAPWVGLS
jgi:4-hydroxyphenylpyruvate dioxygenase